MRKDTGPQASTVQFSPPGRLWLLLLFSYALRVVLACSGGEGFWPDENRYEVVRDAVYHLARKQWRTALYEIFGHADHILFRWVGLPMASLEEAVGRHPALAASYFGLFSVLAIYLIWAVARRAGARESEAFWAAFLAACANSLFYYSRHYFPYDSSLCALLWALWLALGPWSPRNSFLTGVAAGIGFLDYNGYWLLGGVILILHTLIGNGGLRRIAARAACAGAGLALPIVLMIGLGMALGYKLIASMLLFSGTVVQGDFHQGYRVIAEYLWHAEGGLLVLWLAALAYAVWGACREGRWGRLSWYCGALGLLGGGLVLFSDIIPKFVVYGRLTRGLVPFLCLGAAAGIVRMLDGLGGAGRRRAGATIALAAVVCAAVNFATPFRQVFPDGFCSLAAREIDRQPPGTGFGFYRILFAETLWGKRLDVPPPPYPVFLRRRHPMQFRPYQYEAYSAAQRAAINGNDVSMRIIRLPASFRRADPQWDGYPGPVRLSLIFPSGSPRIAEPLLTLGRPDAGDFLFVRYEDETHIAFGLDDWGGDAQVSEPIAIDYHQRHEVVLSAECLLPPEGSDLYRREPEWNSWRHRLLVILDGRVVFLVRQDFHPVKPDKILFGINLIGGSTTQASFSGEVFNFGPASSAAVRTAFSAAGSVGRMAWRP